VPSAPMARMLAPGDPAPDFTLPDQHGAPVSLADRRNRWTVLYFYPRAGTPGCTQQACNVRDRAEDYAAAGAGVLGVSTDAPEILAAFSAEHGLDFPLLSDADHGVADAYGAWVEKNMYGRTHWGVARTTFVIDPDQKIAHVLARAHPRTHDAKILAALASARPGAPA